MHASSQPLATSNFAHQRFWQKPAMPTPTPSRSGGSHPAASTSSHSGDAHPAVSQKVQNLVEEVAIWQKRNKTQDIPPYRTPGPPADFCGRLRDKRFVRQRPQLVYSV